MLSRRELLIGAPLLAAGCAASEGPAQAQDERHDDMEAQFHRLCAGLGRGNRLGVAVIDSGSGRRWSYSGDDRFAMCSTFKVALVAAVLAEAAAGRLRLTGLVAFGTADLLDNSPVSQVNVAAGRLSVEQLCAAAVEVSDNAAANLLLRRVGGPAGLTRFIRAQGDAVTRLDRWELELNSNLAGDPRDTTTPNAMAGLLRTLLLGDGLGAPDRARLIAWMIASTRGPDRLRAGFPPAWRVGTKAGTGARGAMNDLAIVWPPGRTPLIVASYLDAPDHDATRRAATHAAVARIVAAHFA
jgi:beta-lactamase class A